jgi:hypothetical protein
MYFYRLDRATIAQVETELAERRLVSPSNPFPSAPEAL